MSLARGCPTLSRLHPPLLPRPFFDPVHTHARGHGCTRGCEPRAVNKPNGQYVVQPTRDAILGFMAALNVRKIPGIGKVRTW